MGSSIARTAVLLAALAGCGRPDLAPPPEDASPPPRRTTLAEFSFLRWLEGRWGGSENGANPFYEAYRFLDDSTLESRTYADSTFVAATDSGAVRWRNGIVSSGSGGASWVVTAIDSSSVHFEPLEGAINSFTWTRTSPAGWTALLQWKDSAGKAQQRVYQMTRRSE